MTAADEGTAYHEAGHAVVARALCVELTSVVIYPAPRPRGNVARTGYHNLANALVRAGAEPAAVVRAVEIGLIINLSGPCVDMRREPEVYGRGRLHPRSVDFAGWYGDSRNALGWALKWLVDAAGPASVSRCSRDCPGRKREALVEQTWAGDRTRCRGAATAAPSHRAQGRHPDCAARPEPRFTGRWQRARPGGRQPSCSLMSESLLVARPGANRPEIPSALECLPDVPRFRPGYSASRNPQFYWNLLKIGR